MQMLLNWLLAYVLVALLKTSSICAAGSDAKPGDADNVTVPTIEWDNGIGAGNLQGITNNSSCSDVLAWLPARSTPAVVFQVVSEHYVALEENFISNMELHSTFSRGNLYLVCLDTKSVSYFEALGIPCVRYDCMDCKLTRPKIWVLRFEVAKCLLNSGHDVLMSDADAVWIHDPVDDFASHEYRDSNIVGSRGTRPQALSDKWGSSICMGFALFRAGGNAMQVFLTVMGEFAKRLGDDQNAVNEALNELGVIWDPTSDMGFENSTRPGTGMIHNITNVYGDEESFKVSLLPHSKYPRRCREHGHHSTISNITVVAHCLSNEKGEPMAAWMKEEDLWNLPDVTPDPNLRHT